MQYCDVKVENATSREKMLHQCVSFSAKKNTYKDKIQRWLKLIWRSPELNQSWNRPRANDLGLIPTQWAFSIWLWFETQVQFFFSLTLISVLDHRSLLHLIASNYGEKIFQSCEAKAILSTRKFNIFNGCRVTFWI